MAVPVYQNEASVSSGTAASITLTGTPPSAPVACFLGLDKDSGTISLTAQAITDGWVLAHQGSNSGAANDTNFQVSGAAAYNLNPNGGDLTCAFTWVNAKGGSIWIGATEPLTAPALDRSSSVYSPATAARSAPIPAPAATTAGTQVLAMVTIDTGANFGTSSPDPVTWSGGLASFAYVNEAHASLAGLAVGEGEFPSGTSLAVTADWSGGGNEQYFAALLAFRTLEGALPRANVSLTRPVGAKATEFSAVARTGGVVANGARLVVSRSESLANPVYSTFVSPDAAGMCYATITGLAEGTRYFFGWEVNGVLQTNALSRGECKTFTSRLSDTTICFGSCNKSGTDHAIFAHIKARRPDLFFHLGDGNYNNPLATTEQPYRDLFNVELAIPGLREIHRTTPTFRVPGDHDYYSAQDGLGNVAANRAYRQYFPGWTYLDTNPDGSLGKWAIINGILFVLLDTTSSRTPTTFPQNTTPTKTLLGAAQKQAFLDLLALPSNKTRLKFVFSPVPWIVNNTDGDTDNWGGYYTERDAIIAANAAAGVTNIIICTGDMHAVASDGGIAAYPASASPGGYPCFCAAPFNQFTSNKGGPYQYGPIPGGIASGATGADAAQYGWISVTKTGPGVANVKYNGHDSAGAALLTEQSLNFTVDTVAPAAPAAAPTATVVGG